MPGRALPILAISLRSTFAPWPIPPLPLAPWHVLVTRRAQPRHGGAERRGPLTLVRTRARRACRVRLGGFASASARQVCSAPFARSCMAARAWPSRPRAVRISVRCTCGQDQGAKLAPPLVRGMRSGGVRDARVCRIGLFRGGRGGARKRCTAARCKSCKTRCRVPDPGPQELRSRGVRGGKGKPGSARLKCASFSLAGSNADANLRLAPRHA